MEAEIQWLVDDLAARLDRSVSAGDTTMTTFAYSSQPANVDGARMASILTRHTPRDIVAWARRQKLHEASGPVRTPAYDRAQLKERIWAPIRYEGEFLGFLSVIDEGHELPDSALGDVADVADRMGELVHRKNRELELAALRERRLLADLIGDDAEVRRRAAGSLSNSDGLLADSCVVIAACAPVVLSGTDCLTVVHPQGLRSTRLFPFGDVWVMAADVGTQDTIAVTRALAGRVLESLERVRPAAVSESIAIGVGDCVPLQSAHRSHRRALDAIRVAQVFPSYRPIALWDELGSYQVLVAGTRDASAATLDSMLLLLLDVDRHGDLITTLEAYLGQAGDAQATTRILHLHRTSLYYRLNRIEEITGASLRNGEDRLRLHVAIKMARLTGVIAGVPASENAVSLRSS
jgi:hypothetical protein